MDIRIVVTDDGSNTLFVPGLQEHYHSVYGAIAESRHVFTGCGLSLFPEGSSVEILEIGFGTGLNALLSLVDAEMKNKRLHYTAVEPFPLEQEIYSQLNYPGQIGVDKLRFFLLHESPSGSFSEITPFFFLKKIKDTIENVHFAEEHFNLVYFDAFGPDVQPGLWSEDIFRKVHSSMKPGGILVTYSVKGAVKRALKMAGFSVEKLPGPPGKREITRATRK
jgi:tRNA U34 5-methylaminomethyl-2-thiouridine-forming methyltransferase MnmC